MVRARDRRGCRRHAEPRRHLPRATRRRRTRAYAARDRSLPVRRIRSSQAEPEPDERSPRRRSTSCRRRVLRSRPRGARRRGARGRGAISSTRPPSRTTSRLGPVDVDAVFRRQSRRAGERVRAVLLRRLGARADRAARRRSWLYARRGAAFARESLGGADRHEDAPRDARPRHRVDSLHLPFALAAHWWQRRWDQSDLGYLDWLFQDWADAGSRVPVDLHRARSSSWASRASSSDRWWLPGRRSSSRSPRLFTFVAPYLDFTTKPLRDEGAARARRARLRVRARPRRMSRSESRR